jgi:scaffold protein (connect acetoacetyl-CoA thiolase and HMG-CoA synthase)
MPIREPIYHVATQSAAKAWRERLGRYRLMGTVCSDCGTEFYPRRPVCAKCKSLNVADKEFPHTGKIVANAIDFYPLTAYGQQVPVAIAAVQLGNDGPVITSHIVDIDPWEVKIGDHVEMVVRRVRRESNGNYQYSHKFRVIKKGSK